MGTNLQHIERGTLTPMQKRAFLIHGWDGRSDNHWFPYLKWELVANGFEVYAPQMPHAAEPKLAEWLTFLREYVGKPDSDTYFVGHSLGCITVARYLSLLPLKARVGGCVFVAGFSGRPNIPEIREFYEAPFDAKKAKAHCEKFTMIFSDNDRYVPMERSLEFARELGAKTIMEKGKDHFSDGLASLPSALQALLKIAGA